MLRIYTLLLLALFGAPASSFSAWMTKDFCDRQLDEGEIIMNEAAILTNERHVQVFREGTELVSGQAVYVPNEILTVQISDSTGQFVLESQHAEFSGGGCKHKNRVVKNHAALKMPESGTVNVTIKAGWSMGHQQVHLTHSFVLVAPRKRKASILSKHGGSSGGAVGRHKTIGGDGEASRKERKLHAAKSEGGEKKKHGAVDHDKELGAGKRAKKGKKGRVNHVHTVFETKEEADKEQHEVESKHGGGKKGKGAKTHWRRATKIIEKKLRGTSVEGEDNANIVLGALCFVGLVVVFVVYSMFRANRFKISKLMSRDASFKE